MCNHNSGQIYRIVAGVAVAVVAVLAVLAVIEKELKTTSIVPGVNKGTALHK